MIETTEQQERKAERRKQEERAREASAARKRNRAEELRQLHVLATEVAGLMGGEARAVVAGNAWAFVDVSQSHQLSFYREGDQINVRGRVNGVPYAFDVSPRVAPADILEAINRKLKP